MKLNGVLAMSMLLLMLVSIFPTLQGEVVASGPSKVASIETLTTSPSVGDRMGGSSETVTVEGDFANPMIVVDADIYVPENYTTIQEAVNAANPGDTIFVDAGVYNENVDVNKTLNIIGAGQSVAIVNASDPNDHVFHVTANYVDISRFMVLGASGSGKAGIKLDSVGNNVSDNYVTNNYHGIFLDPSSNNIITANTFIDNSYGFYLKSSSNNFIYCNNIINSTILQAYDNGTNTWDKGYPSGGNYWSNWTSPDNYTGVNQDITGLDFFVDYPYNLSGGTNQDHYPSTIRDRWKLFVPGVLLVKFNPGVPGETINSTIAQYGTEVMEYFDSFDVYALRINVTNRGEHETVYRFEGDPNVDFALLDYCTYLRTHLTHPNDPNYPNQWGLNNYGRNPGVPVGVIDADIDAPQAWEHKTDCSDIVVAVIDTGVDLGHPDLVGNLWTNPGEIAGDGIDNDGNGVIDDIHGADFGYNRRTRRFVNDGEPEDRNGHGTHVAGIIGAVGNNGIGVTGVNWRASMMILKDAGPWVIPNLITFMQSMNYILWHKARGVNVRVISFSAGMSPWDFWELYRIPRGRAQLMLIPVGILYSISIAAANAQEILFVCAAGYDGVDVDATGTRDYPAALPNPNIISVTASNNTDHFITHWDYVVAGVRGGNPNWGSTSIDLAAPGEDILSLGLGGTYVYMSGTSMATPFVSGAVAHFWSLFLGLGHLAVKDWILKRVDPRPGIRGGAPPAGVNRVVSGKNRDGRLRMICGDDFGDAPDIALWHFYPTKTRYHGASHEDIGEEWLGYCATSDVSPEFDADVGFPWDADPDLLPNTLPSRVPATPEPPYNFFSTIPDLELYDDGVIFLTPFIPCQMATIAYSIRTENEDKVDFEGGRYLPGQTTTLAPNKGLHINIWIDWSGDYDWDDPLEHVYYDCHNATLEWNGTHCSGWQYVTFHVPRSWIDVPYSVVIGETYLRARLDYGENVGAISKYDQDPSLHDWDGLAQFGEVEDYRIYIGEVCADIALTNVTPSKTVVGQSYTVSINVTVENQGNLTETFHVRAYANTTIIDTLVNINLTSGNSTTVTFTWNTTAVAKGNHTIKATATPLPGETDTTDNNLTDGTIQIVIPGDVNADGTCNMKDIYQLIRHFMCSQGQPCYVANYDINCDGTINMKDIYTAIRHYGET